MGPRSLGASEFGDKCILRPEVNGQRVMEQQDEMFLVKVMEMLQY